MNYYEKRIALLDKETLPREVFGDGRERYKKENYFRSLKVGDKVYPTVWFLRNIEELDRVVDVATNGLTITEVGEVYDREGKWGIGGWQGCNFKVYFFEEISRPLSFKLQLTQQIWKVEKQKK